MHVLIPVIHRPIKPTGVCRHAVNLAQCLATIDAVNKVTLIIGEWQTAYFEQSFDLESAKIQVVSIATHRSSILRNIWYLKELPKVANALAADIVHMSFPFPFIRWLFKASVVCSTIHDVYPFECPENFGYPQAWFNQWFLKQSIGNSDRLACVAQVTLEKLNEFFPEHSDQLREVIYNYVDFEKINPVPPAHIKESNSTESNYPFLLSVAQHRKNKNLDVLIQAFSSLLKQGRLPTNTQLILVGGTGPETETLETIVNDLNLEKQVRFLSALSDNELCWLYKHCELFVIPSSTEGFCLPLVEALAWDAKVVCSDIPIFREVGNSSCTYFDITAAEISDRPRADPFVETSFVKSPLIGQLAEAIACVVATSSTKNNHLSPQHNPQFSKDYVAQQLLDFYASRKPTHAET